MESLASYLVSLGFKVDQAEFSNATAKLKEVEKTVASTTASMAKNFAIAGTAITVTLLSITKAVADLTMGVAENDLAFQKLANRMWMSKDATKEMKMATDALGESIEDIAFTPELRQQYEELIELSRQVNTPSDASGQLKEIRSIMFEFKKMKLEVAYATEWIAYYLAKYLGGPLGDLKKKLQDFNMKLVQEMPEWTKKIAKVLATIINVEMSVVRFIKGIYDGFNRFFDMLPKGMSTAVKSILALWAVLKFTPIGWLTMAIMGVMVLIEDFYGYVDGRKSSKTLGPIWQKLIDFFKLVDKWTSETLPKFIAKFDNLIDIIMKLVNETLKTLYLWLVVIFDEISGACERGGVMESFIDAFGAIGDGVTSLIEGFTELMKTMGLFSKDTKFKGFWRWFGDELSSELKLIALFIKTLGHLANEIGLMMKGDFKGAMELDKRASRELKNGVKSYFSGDSDTSNEEMMKLAQSVSAKTGVSADYIYGQWYHETQGFSSKLMRENNNLGGMTQVEFNGSENKQPDGNNYYKMFNSPQEYADYYASYINRYMPDLKDSSSTQDFASRLKRNQYYTADEDEYTNGVRNGIEGYYYNKSNDVDTRLADNQNTTTDYTEQIRNARLNYQTSKENAMSSYMPQPTASNYQAGQTIVNVGDINIAGTNVSATEIQTAVTSGIAMAQDRQTARNMRDFGGVIA